MKAKVRSARLASRLGGDHEQWRMWGPRRNRFQGGIIKKKILDSENFQLSSALARMYSALDQSEQDSSCSVVGLAIEDRPMSPIVGGWIRKTHVSEQNRRSPIFTERFYRRDECFDDSNPHTSRSLEQSADGAPMRTSSRPSISQRLGPRVDSPQREQFDSHSSSWSYYKANRDYVSTDPRYSDSHPDRYSPQPQRSQDYHQLPPNYRSGYYPERLHSSDPRSSKWPQHSSYSDYPPGYPEYDERTNGDYRRRGEDDNNGSYPRDEYTPLPSSRHSYRQSLYYSSNINSPQEEYMMDQRQKGSRADQSINNYPGYPPNYRDSYYEDERRNQWSSYSNSQMDDYNSNMAQRRSHSFRQSLYYAPERSSPHFDSMMKSQQQRPWMEPQMNRGGPPGPGKQGFYQDRFSDEDFSDSDQLESEAEEDVLKKQTREMWKNLVKERGVLVAHIGASAEMTKEQGEHAKKALMEKAKDPNITYPDSWRPRFLRSGMVHRTGLYQLICQDYQTLKWVLQQEIPPLDGHKFSILKRPYDWDCGPVRINTWLPPEPVDQQATLEAIEAENPGIGSSRWRLESISFEEGWRQLVADISCESALYLEKNGWTILFWACVLPVTRMSNVSKSLFVHQEDNALLAL